jgi:hypothetical protein
MTRATLLYRIGSLVLILFAAGHTYGFLAFKPPTAEGRAVFESMQNVRFQVKSAVYSYGGFYQGFGLSITANLLLLVYLSWHLGSMAATNPQSIGFLGWAFFALQLVSLVLSWIYFSAGPAILSGLLAVLLGWAAS